MSDKDKAPHRPLGQDTTDEIKSRVIHGVGYKHPPGRTRFQKGSSGNPNGRPRGAPADLSLSDQPTLAAALRAANRTIRKKENGEVSDVSMRDAMMEATAAAALKGNARSAGLFMDWVRTAEAAHARELKARVEFWSNYQATGRQVLAEASKRGEPPPKLLPHPDDIEFDSDEGPKFVGPFDETGQARLEETIRFRNLLIMQDELDQRSATRLNGEPLNESGSALLLAHVLERSVPARLRLSDLDWVHLSMKSRRLSKRELMKELFRGWRRLGKNFPRGFVFPDRGLVRRNLELLIGFMKAGLDGSIDIEAASRGKFDDNLLSLLEEHGYRSSSSSPLRTPDLEPTQFRRIDTAHHDPRQRIRALTLEGMGYGQIIAIRTGSP